MPLNTAQLVKIAAAGGGLDVDCSAAGLNAQEMTKIAEAAADSGTKPSIVFRNYNLNQVNMEKIAAAGKGCVVFIV